MEGANKLAKTKTCDVGPIRKLRKFVNRRNRSSVECVAHISDPHTNTLVNRARMEWGLPLLERSQLLDDMAFAHAQEMASRGSVFHGADTNYDLQVKLGSIEVGEDVFRGVSESDVYDKIMMSSETAVRTNLECPTFNQHGVGIAHCDGMVYLCFLYRST